MDVGADQIQDLDAEVPVWNVGHVADAAGIALLNDEAAHVESPDGNIAVGFRRSRGNAKAEEQERNECADELSRQRHRPVPLRGELYQVVDLGRNPVATMQ